MKNILITLCIFIAYTSCKAQIVPLNSTQPAFVRDSGEYYKDVNNEYDPFTGTWVYQNGATSITLVLEKEINIYDQDANYHYDILIGEYEYIQNGQEIINTLPNIIDQNITDYSHNINGGNFLGSQNAPVCDECGINEIRVTVSMSVPNTYGVGYRVIFRHIIVNGIEQLEATFYDNTSNLRTEGVELPFDTGEYTFIKQ